MAKTSSDETKTAAAHTTVSGRSIKALYTAEDLAPNVEHTGPGQFPYTRGIHTSGYVESAWLHWPIWSSYLTASDWIRSLRQ